MEAKTFEVRDAMTFIPVMAVNLKPGNLDDRYLLARAGYGTSAKTQAGYTLLWRLSAPGRVEHNPNNWGDGLRTMQEAHEYIKTMFDDLDSGDVVDLQFIRGETDEPKVSESLPQP